MMPNRLEILKDAFWSGQVSEVEFKRLAAEAGATEKQIADFLTEVRECDGVL